MNIESEWNAGIPKLVNAILRIKAAGHTNLEDIIAERT